MSFFEYFHDSDNTAAEKTDTLLLAFSNVKVGLLNNVDLQLVFALYERQALTSGAFSLRDGDRLWYLGNYEK